MALPAVSQGVSYPLVLSSYFSSNSPPKAQKSATTYHSFTYAPKEHTPGAHIPAIDAKKPATLTTAPNKAHGTSNIGLSFTDVQGENPTFAGPLFSSMNEFVLLFDGTSFTLHPVASGVRAEDKKKTERKRSPEDAADLPNAKRQKTADLTSDSSTHTSIPIAAPSASQNEASQPQSAAAAVSFSLNKPKKAGFATNSSLHASPAPAAVEATPTIADKTGSLSQSAELRIKRDAELNEPDSDDSDDSD